MKNLLFFGSVLLFLGGCASQNQATPNGRNAAHYPPPQDAVLHGKLLWQDQPVNATKLVSQEGAFNYCFNLNFADVKGWRLPTISEAKQLQPIASKLQHNANGYYHSATKTCGYKIKKDPIELLFSPLTIAAQTLDKAEKALQGNPGSCGYKVSPKGFDTTHITRGHVRCVINAERYYEAQQKKAEKIARLKAQDDFEANLELYRITKDIQYIKRAYAKATSLQQKLKAERLLVETMKDKIFDIIGGENGPSKLSTQRGTVLGVVSGAAFTNKDFAKSFTVKSDFLEYGTYRVKVKFTLKLHYRAVMFGIGTGTTEKETKIVTFTLSPKNHFRQTKVVRFKNIAANMQQSLMGVNAVSIRLKNAELSYELVGVE